MTHPHGIANPSPNLNPSPSPSSSSSSSPEGMITLDEELLRAHARGEAPALATLYAKAAKMYAGQLPEIQLESGRVPLSESVSEPVLEPVLERAAFYLTHAYVFALEAGLDEADIYHAQLKKWGCEE